MNAVKYKSGTGFLLATLGRRVEFLWNAFLKEHRISTAEFTALAILDTRGSSTQKQLAQECEVDPRNMVSTTKKLHARGWITIAADPSDGRAKVLRSTVSGRETLQSLYAELRPIEDGFMRSLSIDDRYQLQKLLMTLKKDSDELAQSLRKT